MRLSSVPQCSLHLEGLQAVLVRSIPYSLIKMKYAVFFLLCVVALAAAAPQFITTFPGYVAPTAARTLVTGPTVVNGYGAYGTGYYGAYGARYVAPGFFGTTFV